MYKIVHLPTPTGEYVIDLNTKLPLTWFSKTDLINQTFENRLACFRRLNWNNKEEDPVYYIHITNILNEEEIVPKFFFEIVEETSFWSV